MSEYESAFDAVATNSSESSVLKTKAQLMRHIRLQTAHLTKSDASRALCVNKKVIKHLRSGHISRFDIEWLMELAVLVGLGPEVKVTF